MKRPYLATLVCLSLVLQACGRSAAQPESREPVPAPRVVLSADDQQRWAPGPPTRDRVPVLLYHRLGPGAFARQMVLLDHAGYQTITLDELARFVNRRAVTLPPRPILLTFDGGRLASWRESDGILRELGFNAVMFVDVGRVEANDPAFLTWDELNRIHGSGRWDIQLQSGTGNHKIQYGPDPDDIGPFYAYRGSNEVLGGWRERVFSDITYGEEQLTHHIRNYRPLAVAPPYGNYGQAATNDRRIPHLLLARLQQSFQLVFTQDRTGLATPRQPNPLGRIEITPRQTEAQLHTLLDHG